MEELKRLDAEIKRLLRAYRENKLSELLVEANCLRRQYAELDVKLNGGK